MCFLVGWVHPRVQPANTGQAVVIGIFTTALSGVKTPGLESGFMVWKLTFWPRKRLLVESTVKLSTGDPSVVLSAEAALLTSPCFCWDNRMHSINHPSHKYSPPPHPSPPPKYNHNCWCVDRKQYLRLPSRLFCVQLLGRCLLNRFGFLLGGGGKRGFQFTFGSSLLSQELWMDVGQDSTSRDSHTFQQLKKHKVTPGVHAAFTVKRGMKGERTSGSPLCNLSAPVTLTHRYFQFTQMCPVYSGTPTRVTADLVQLLVVGDGQKDVSWRNATLLVISGSITCQLQDLSCNSR